MEVMLRDTEIIDEKGLKNLFDEFFQALCMFATSYVKDDGLARDIVQESFLTLWYHRKELRHPKSLKSFLYTVVRNHCLNSIKKEKKEQKDLSMLESDSFCENALIQMESYRMLYHAIEELPYQTRRVINLSLDGLKNDEIAEKLGVSANTVHTLKKAAYKKLRAKLKEHFYLLLLLLS